MRSQLLAAALVIMTGVFLAVDTTYLLTTPGYDPPYYGYGFLGLSYALNRAGRYRIAASLVLTMFTLVPLIHVFSGASRFPQMTLSYLCLGPGLGAILLPASGIALMASIDLFALALAPVLAPSILPWSAAVGPLALTAISGLTALLSAHQRDQLERERVADLAASEARLRMALDAARMGIWDVDSRTQRVVTSDQVGHILGLPGTAVAFQSYAAAVHPDERAVVEAAFLDPAGLQDGAVALSHRLLRPDGEVRWVEVTGRAVADDTGVGARRVGTIVDVTERKLMEEQLRQAQKLEAIGRLAGGVAHDFNNLLTVILGNVELMRAQQPTAGIDDIEHAAQSAAKLTQQLLAFSRRAVINPQVVVLDDVLRRAVSMLARIIGEDIRTELQLAPEAWHVRVDGGQVEQVILNLATNARDAMPRGGTLTIATHNVTLTAESAANTEGAHAGDYVMITVTDTGSGMSPDTCGRIFEPFFTTKELGKGTGLGLAMVFGVVTQSEGFLEVESELGRGTTFRIYFPRTEAVANVRTPERPTSETQRGLILLVEDDASVRIVTSRMLELSGYRVHAVESPAAARAYWATHADAVDLLITDLVMPGGGGRDLALELRAQRPALRVLFVTGYDPGSQPSTENATTLGKPFSREELLAATRSVLTKPATP